MIDLHCHILPGVDDGPPDLISSIEMARQAVSLGITHLFAAPHHLDGRYENTKNNILNAIQAFNQQLEQEQIPLIVHSAQELRIHRMLIQSIKSDEILTLDNNGSYLLVELPFGEVPSYTQEIVYELLLRGIIPIIVHPERNKGFLENKHLLQDLVQEGALTQLTAGSILGRFGKKVKLFSEQLIEHHLIHFIASDAHNISTRSFSLKEAYDAISKSFGVDRSFYFQENAEYLLRGQHPQIEKPVPIRKKYLGIF
ncbi:protein-tyrosine phosphatase [Bacillus sp. SORGH_AS 510]|uniref:tyrosine-protein phosphatase n=1 Tax=Bacillus sp. SORGH_AS_0510 TaxID=3041771 RepID=UPI0027851CF6|nr:CpsB/CapC family capsule biosynthesis tyrosine phosphatase [Bacillus sp. SORGH_AS_0510]MDQ1144587.1 protein-tyrosine phosphatase [Bacillus sp. SORGH_AS_0510]